VLVREREAVKGVVEASAVPVDEGLFRLSLRVTNRTPCDGAGCPDRDAALLRSFASTHAVLDARPGGFVSLTDPPERWRAAADGCRNIGVWPVLVGEEGETSTVLASPIILPDYPRVAPESPGDFFDGTEIDEMLTLRILTLTDEEKHAMASVDGRAAALLARTEATAREQLLGLHGTFRHPGPSGERG
jgi:hydrogenase maturation protease